MPGTAQARVMAHFGTRPFDAGSAPRALQGVLDDLRELAARVDPARAADGSWSDLVELAEQGAALVAAQKGLFLEYRVGLQVGTQVAREALQSVDPAARAASGLVESSLREAFEQSVPDHGAAGRLLALAIAMRAVHVAEAARA